MRKIALIPAFLLAATALQAVDEVPRLELDFENSGNRLQNTGSVSNPFAATGPTNYTAGINGGTAIVFGGSNHLTATISPVTTGFTLSFWMKTSTAVTPITNHQPTQWYWGAGLVNGEIPGETEDWGVSLVGNKVALGIGAPDLTTVSTTSVTDNQWHFIAATWSSSAGIARLYINGNLEATITSTGRSPRRTDNPFYIGYDANGLHYTGLMDQIRFYNRAFSVGEVQMVQTGEAVPFELPEVPEPSTYGLILGGLALAGAAIRRRSKK